MKMEYEKYSNNLKEIKKGEKQQGRRAGKQREQTENNKIIDLNLTISINTLIVNGLNTPIIVPYGILKKQDSTIYCLQEAHFKYSDVDRLKVKGWKKDLPANSNQKNVVWAIVNIR